MSLRVEMLSAVLQLGCCRPIIGVCMLAKGDMWSDSLASACADGAAHLLSFSSVDTHF